MVFRWPPLMQIVWILQGQISVPKRTVSVAGSRTAVRLTVRSTSAEIVSAIEADKPAFVQVRCCRSNSQVSHKCIKVCWCDLASWVHLRRFAS